MAGVNLHHVFKVYDGGVRAVNDFDLEIKDKEFIVFVGPSGCGKSTTLRMIAGLEDITAGHLYIDGELMNDVDSKNRDIAMVFQSYALYPHMTVYDNMAFGLKLRHIPKKEIDRRVKNAANILEIGDLLSRKPKALSGGQRQRVALGRTIVREPKVFLLDEPLSNLDAKLRVAMRSEITKLYEKLQTTFIYVTHDQTEAMTMGSRIVVMKDGYIQQADTPITLFEDPCNLFVATFLGSPQMNIISANLFKEKGKLKARLLNDKNLVIEFPEVKAKQLVDDSYIGKEVLIGIRPENILLNKGALKSYVDVVEHLGDQTILYTKINNLKDNFIIKIPFNGNLKSNKEITFGFDMNRIYMFDKDTQKAIMGIPHEDLIPVSISSKKILTIGKQEFNLEENLGNKLLSSAYGLGVKLSIKPDYISLTEIGNSIKLKAHLEFKEQKTDYQAVYFSIKNVKGYFAFKAPKNLKLTMDKDIVLYLPFEKISFIDKKLNKCNSRENVHENKVIANVVSKSNKTKICFGNNILEYPLIKNIKNGKHEIILDQNKVLPIFNKKMIKQGYKNNFKFNKKETIKVDAYDENVLGNKNIIYVKINGFRNYATFVVDNNFSVYKMPSFRLYIPIDAIKIK